MTAPRRRWGQSLVELALVLPILVMLVFGVLDFAYYLFVNISLTNATRTAARCAAMNNRTRLQIAGIVVASSPGVLVSTANVAITTHATDASRPGSPPTVEILTRLEHRFFAAPLWPLDTLPVKAHFRSMVVTTPQQPNVEF